jgi:hypothetical protein
MRYRSDDTGWPDRHAPLAAAGHGSRPGRIEKPQGVHRAEAARQKLRPSRRSRIAKFVRQADIVNTDTRRGGKLRIDVHAEGDGVERKNVPVWSFDADWNPARNWH